MIQRFEIPVPVEDQDRFTKWAKHLGMTVKQSNKNDQCVILDVEDGNMLNLYWLGHNINSGLPAPEDQTRAGNSEYLRKITGNNTFPEDPKCPSLEPTIKVSALKAEIEKLTEYYTVHGNDTFEGVSALNKLLEKLEIE